MISVRCSVFLVWYLSGTCDKRLMNTEPCVVQFWSREMGTVTIENDSGELAYDLLIELFTSDGTWQHGKTLAVERMFDKDGSETFDPTQCVEVEVDNSLYRLKHGDKLRLDLEVH
jgi:hypothetical protein